MADKSTESERMKLFGNPPETFFDGEVKSFPWPVKVLNVIVTRVVWLWSKLYWHWTCDGPNPWRREASVGRIFVANHASMLDPALLMSIANVSKCTLRPLYKGEFNASRIATWLFSRVGAVPINRGTADMKAIRRAVNSLKRGENVLVFPEGTRIWDPQARPEIFGGFALIAQMAGADVVPVAIDGTERINPYKKHLLSRPARVYVRYGEPVRLEDVEGASRKEKVANLEAVAMGRIYAMRESLRREHGRS